MTDSETSSSQSNAGDLSEDIEWGGIRGQIFWLDGVRITPFDCPSCLEQKNLPCVECPYFAPSLCRLRRNPYLREDLENLFAYYRDREYSRREHERIAVEAIRKELEEHGRPLHYTVLARIVADRHPELHLSETTVLRLLNEHGRHFDRIEQGVFRHL
jgi:hypothetical protein